MSYVDEFIHDSIDNFELVSFDIFDTFLLRPFIRPTDLFIRLAGEKFARKRIEAERLSRMTVGERTTIDSIYKLLPDELKHFKDQEVALETELLVVNPEIKKVYDFAKSKGKKVVFTSDMYLGHDILKEILASKGVTDYDGLYVSCDYGYNKSSGSLLRTVLSDFSVDDRRALHIGDNLDSDIRGAGNACMYGFYYPRIADVFFNENFFIKSFASRHDRMNNSTTRMFLGALALAWHLNACSHGASMWHNTGCLFTGVLTYLFSKFIAQKCAEYGKSRILLSLRDAYIVGRVSDFMLRGFKCEYVYGNRGMTRLLTRYLDGVADRPETEAYEYFKNFNVEEDNCIIVEGFSQNMSFQNAISRLVGKKVDAVYCILNNKATESSMSFMNRGNIPGCLDEIYEFCNGSPEKPVACLDGGSKIYLKSSENGYEEYRSLAYERLVAAAVDTARVLNNAGVSLDTQDLESYFRHFCTEVSPGMAQFLLNQYKPSSIDGYDYHTIFWK